jgi:hypothetical protein
MIRHLPLTVSCLILALGALLVVGIEKLHPSMWMRAAFLVPFVLVALGGGAMIVRGVWSSLRHAHRVLIND